MTNWWEHLFRGKGRDEAGELERQQGINLARAAAKTATLEHYMWSTLPSAKKATGGKILVPHLSVNSVVFFCCISIPDMLRRVSL